MIMCKKDFCLHMIMCKKQSFVHAMHFFKGQTLRPTIMDDIMFTHFNDVYNDMNILHAKYLLIILYSLSIYALTDTDKYITLF